MEKRDYEDEQDKRLWKISISMMTKAGDIEGLKDLKDGPEVLDEEILEILDKAIKTLENHKRKEKE